MGMVGEHIRQRRMEKNLPLAELARRAEISKGYLHTIESGETQSPSAEILFRIANELGTTIADLLGQQEEVDVEAVDFPETLRAFAEEANLTESDVQMLARIQYRGKQPETAEDWRFIFESIRRTIR